MPKVSLDVAQDHLVRTSVVTADGNRLPLSSGPEKIGAVTGVGIQLYFTSLKYIGCAFFLWSCFQLPLFIINIHSTGGSGGSGLALTTVFNLGEAKKLASEVYKIRSGDSWMIPGLGRVVIHDMVPWFGILDAVGLLVFMTLVGWFCYRVLPTIVKKFDNNTVTPTDIAIEISGLPDRVADHETYEAQLTEHIVNICQRARRDASMPEDPNPELIVLENSLVRDYNGRLLEFQNLDKLQKRLDNAREKDYTVERKREIEKIEDKMQKLRENTKTPIGKPEARNVKNRAYVMLNSRENKDVLLDYYRFANTIFLRSFQMPHMRFNGCALKIVEAPEPSDIMWENQDRDQRKVFIRRCMAVLLSIVIFSFSFAIIISAQFFTEGLQAEVDKCEPSVDPVTLANWRGKLMEGPIDACGCQEIGLLGVSTDKTLAENICKDWFTERVRFFALIFLGAVVIVVVNLTLNKAVNWFTKLGRPLTQAKYYSSFAIKIFVAQFFNTTIIILLANTDIFSNFYYLAGGHDDFDRRWYDRVGVAIIMPLLVTAFFPHCIAVAIYPVRICFRKYLSRRAATQHDLNQLYTWPNFQLATRLAGLLNVMFSTMLYSAGVPLLSIIATVTIFLVFFCDKFLLLRASKMPPVYDQSLLLVFKELFPLACFLHATFAIYMFGHSLVFPSDSDVFGSSSQIGDIGDFFVRTFFERCLAKASFANFVLWVLIAIFLTVKLLKLIFGAAFGNFFRAIGVVGTITAGDLNKELVENKQTSRKRKQRLKQNRDIQLFTYALEKNPTYAGWMQQADGTMFDKESRATFRTGTLQHRRKTSVTSTMNRSRNSARRPPPVVTDAPSDENSPINVSCNTIFTDGR
eukprot:GEMP01004446.1.p1 GENE.GEMP01004446.1~~GEMP01004446.1.p1  ORF type:complete len:860 (+),score=85.48 GEMP01004446.1:197-2776(+)